MVIALFAPVGFCTCPAGPQPLSCMRAQRDKILKEFMMLSTPWA